MHSLNVPALCCCAHCLNVPELCYCVYCPNVPALCYCVHCLNVPALCYCVNCLNYQHCVNCVHCLNVQALCYCVNCLNVPALCYCVHCLNVPALCVHICPADGSFEPKGVAEFLILITIYIVVLLTGILLLHYSNEFRIKYGRTRVPEDFKRSRIYFGTSEMTSTCSVKIMSTPHNRPIKFLFLRVNVPKAVIQNPHLSYFVAPTISASSALTDASPCQIQKEDKGIHVRKNECWV